MVGGRAKDIVQRAHARWKELLTGCEPPPLDPATDEALQAFMDNRNASMDDAWH